MTDPATSADSQPAAEPHPDEQFRIFWQKYGKGVLALFAAAVLAVCAKGFWDYLAARRDASLQEEFAAADTPAKLRAFADAHAGETLAGVAELRLADEAYGSGRVGEALAGYEKAAGAIKAGPLAARVQLGLALCKIQAGQAADGEAALARLLDDAQQLNAVRAEAGYHLASAAATAGRSADVQKYAAQILQIDPSSPWAQRAFALEATLPPAPAPVPAAPVGQK